MIIGLDPITWLIALIASIDNTIKSMQEIFDILQSQHFALGSVANPSQLERIKVVVH